MKPQDWIPFFLLAMYLGSMFIMAWTHRRTVNRLLDSTIETLKTTNKILGVMQFLKQDNDRLRKVLWAHYLDENEEIPDGTP